MLTEQSKRHDVNVSSSAAWKRSSSGDRFINAAAAAAPVMIRRPT
jgi:hypothetical protein